MKERGTLTESMFYVLMSFFGADVRHRDHGVCGAEN